MKPYYTYGWTPLSPNIINEKSEEASKVRSYDFSRLLDSTVNFNTVELAMRQMSKRIVVYILCTITSFLKHHKSQNLTKGGPSNRSLPDVVHAR